MLVGSPSQTLGPLFGSGLMFDGSELAVDTGAPDAVRVSGLLADGNGPVVHPDGMIEVWIDDVFARARTDGDGRYTVVIAKRPPPSLPGAPELAPFLNVTVFARGLLKQVQTRLYFPDEAEANERDPILARVEPDRRELLVASYDEGGLRFDVHLQGVRETPILEF